MNAPFHINLSEPSFAGAIEFARRAYAEAGNDRAAGNAVLAKALFWVEAREGGFLGASDEQADAVCRRLKITTEQFSDALYNRGLWPGAVQ